LRTPHLSSQIRPEISTLDTASTGGTAGGGLRDALDVVEQDFAVTLRAALSETLSQGQRLQKIKEKSQRTFPPFLRWVPKTWC